MRFPFIVHRWLLLLAVVGVGGCQRASYQLQPVVEAAYQPPPSAQAPGSAVVTIPAQPAAQPSASYQEMRQQLHRSAARPHRVRIKAPLARARLSAAASAATQARRQQHPQQEPGPVLTPVRYRSRGLAIVLAALSLTYLPLSLHNFYLGYYGRGVLAIALVVVGTYLLLLGFLGSLFSGGGLVGLGLVGLAMLGGWFIWQLVDLVRIITKDLKPKNGEYNPRLFQTSPDAANTSPTRTN